MVSPSPPPSPNPPCTRLQVWDLTTGRCVLKIEENGRRIRHLGFTPTAQYLVETTDYQANQQTVTRYHLASGTSSVVCEMPARDKHGVYSPLQFRLSPDHATVYVSEQQRYNSEKRLMLWKADTGECVLSYSNILNEPFWFAQNGKKFEMPICIPMQKTLQIVIRSFELATRNISHSPDTDEDTLKKMMPPWSITRWICSPNDRYVIGCCSGWSILIDRTRNGNDGYMTHLQTGEHDHFHFSEDGKHLFVSGHRVPSPGKFVRCLEVFSLPDAKLVARHQLDWPGILVGPWFVEHQDIVGDPMKNENSQLLIIRDAVTGKERTRFMRNEKTGHRLVTGPITLIPNRSTDWLAYYHYQPGIAYLVFRNVATGELERFPVDPSCTDNIAFSNDGSRMAVPTSVTSHNSDKVWPTIAVHRLARIR